MRVIPVVGPGVVSEGLGVEEAGGFEIEATVVELGVED